jgi:hypothetical protein
VEEDLFRTKTAFFALLNFPVDTLAERLEQGPAWSRRRWARSRFMDASPSGFRPRSSSEWAR